MNKKLKIIIFTLLALVALTFIIGWLKHSNVEVFNSAGSVGEKERNLMLFALGLSLVVVIPVFVLLFSFAWRYREGNKKKAKYSPNLSGHWAAESVWWVIPTILITILSVVTWNSSHALDPYKQLASSKKTMTVEVIAMDWKWLFIYPDQHVASINQVYMPVNTPVRFVITADNAPMNSFWVPQLGGQIYAMPGMSTQLNLVANRTGDYHGSSANISGDGFSRMDFTVRAGSEQGFQSWIGNARQHPALTAQVYNQLIEPSEANAVNYYSDPADDLFEGAILKYMLPETSHGPAYQVLPYDMHMDMGSM